MGRWSYCCSWYFASTPRRKGAICGTFILTQPVHYLMKASVPRAASLDSYACWWEARTQWRFQHNAAAVVQFLVPAEPSASLAASLHSYARWWEARTQWGSNLATMRNYTRLLAQWCPPDKKYILHAARRWVPGEGQGGMDVSRGWE